MTQGSRKLQIRLPLGHPIWSYPPGQRAAVARWLMDTGLRLKSIEDRLAAVEQELKRLPAGPPASMSLVGQEPEAAEIEKFRQGILSVWGAGS